jgi:hypothetical protein
MCSLRLRTSMGNIATSQKLSAPAKKTLLILMRIYVFACAKNLFKLVFNEKNQNLKQKSVIVNVS